MKEIKSSPCVGICSTVYGDSVCRGCMRFYDEVIDWNRYGDTQKYSVYQRIEFVAEVACQGKLAVVDLVQLKAALSRYHIPHEPWMSALHLAYYFLRCRSTTLKNFEQVGLCNQTTLDPVELLSVIEEKMRDLSEQAFAQQSEHA